MEIMKCIVCKNVTSYKGETINVHIVNVVMGSNDEHVCIDCAESYYCQLELKGYRQHCKDRNIKIDKTIIDKIMKNEWE
jgi:hypothetical protein